MKTLRKAVFRSRLEGQLAKYERRIQKMAENAYKIRQVIENMMREEAQNAVHNTGSEGIVGDAPSSDTGGANVPAPTTSETVLDEQSA